MNAMEARMKEVANKKNNRKMYHFKGLRTPHIILYPLMVICWACGASFEKLANKIRSCCKWNTKRAYRIITEEIVRHGSINSSNGTIYYTWRRWGNWWFDKYRCKLKDHTFCLNFNKQITEYLVNEYQIAGYTKEVDDTDSDWYSFTFTRET